MSVDGPPTPPSPESQQLTRGERRMPSNGDGGRDAQQAPSGFRVPLNRLEVFSTRLHPATVNSFCGAVAGAASGIVTCPLDVIKTRLQSQGSFNRKRPMARQAVYNGLIGTARIIWRDDGVRGMYRGLGPMLLGYLPTWAVYMTVYERSKDYYQQRIDNKWLARGAASITAGACSTLVTNPIWVIKTRLMSQVSARASEEHRPPWHYKSTFDAARKMYTNEGVRAFYSGLTPALLGLSHVAIQFPLYEYFKTQFTGLGMGENSKDDSNVHWFGVAMATFLSKICATSATYPHEVLRTRLQTQQRSFPTHSPEGISFRGALGYGPHVKPPGTSSSDGMINLPRYRGVIRTCKTMLVEEGWRSFYNGMGTNMVRAVPAAMTTMLTYEWLKKMIWRLQVEGAKLKEEEQPW